MSKMVFFNGGWMSLYNGVDNDSIVNGGSYISKNNFGGEVYNFKNNDGSCYGYVMTKSGTINLKRINNWQEIVGDVLKDVICVFVATHPKGGRKIVGWYQNADIYSQYQYYQGNDRPIKTNQEDWDDESNQVGYYAKAEYKNVVLLTEDERMSAPEVPTGKDGFGQSNVWYANTDVGTAFIKEVSQYISQYNVLKVKKKTNEEGRRNRSKINLNEKKKVEERAIKRTKEYYENLGYTYTSVEEENKGWDLEVEKGHTKLLVEVKGLSQSFISVMLSRNEYEKMKLNKESYRLSVVTNCLDQSHNPPINIFSYIEEQDAWFDQNENKLMIEEIVAARCEL